MWSRTRTRTRTPGTVPRQQASRCENVAGYPVVSDFHSSAFSAAFDLSSVSLSTTSATPNISPRAHTRAAQVHAQPPHPSQPPTPNTSGLVLNFFLFSHSARSLMRTTPISPSAQRRGETAATAAATTVVGGAVTGRGWGLRGRVATFSPLKRT